MVVEPAAVDQSRRAARRAPCMAVTSESDNPAYRTKNYKKCVQSVIGNSGKADAARPYDVAAGRLAQHRHVSSNASIGVFFFAR